GVGQGGTYGNVGTLVRAFRRTDFSQINVNGGDGDDTLTIDQSFGDPIPSVDLLYDGHGGNNRLLVVGGTFDREIDLAIGPRDGNLEFTPGSSLSYTNVASIDDLSTVTDFQFRNVTTALFKVVSIDATATIRSPADQFVPMHFGNKTNVTIQGLVGLMNVIADI